MTLPDNETRVDLLNNEAIAATIIKLLRDQQARPVTVGAQGPREFGFRSREVEPRARQSLRAVTVAAAD
jgi:hypothetical protein